VAQFRAEYRELVQYYQLAYNVHRFSRLKGVVERTDGKAPPVAEWGGIPLRRQPTANAILNNQPTRVWNVGTELLQRFLADTCELCGSTDGVQVHHIRALKDLQPQRKRKKRMGQQPEWVKVMIARHRKTLVACQTCHGDIHQGRPPRHSISLAIEVR
jgi:hypothetical protein